MMAETYVRHVQLLGFEKRFFPSQHYVSLNTYTHTQGARIKMLPFVSFPDHKSLSLQVYMLLVKWSDLTEKLIYRTYPEIYTFHVGSSRQKNLCLPSNVCHQLYVMVILAGLILLCFVTEIPEGDVSH